VIWETFEILNIAGNAINEINIGIDAIDKMTINFGK